MDEKEMSRKLRDEEEEEEETRSLLISSLPSYIDCLGFKLYKYQGCWYYYNNLQGVVNFQRNFPPQETDIIVASYPKSGTTWLKALTFALVGRSKHPLNDDDHPLLSHNPHDQVQFLEFDLYLNSSKPDLTKLFSSSSSLSTRLFSTHIPFHTLDEGLRGSPCKIVYLCRNVKDVLVSLVSRWFFVKSNNRENSNGVENSDFEAMFESFCSGVNCCGPFWDQVLSYWRESLEDPKHVFFMRYEEMKAERREQIKRLAEFLGCPFTEVEVESGSVDEVLHLCSLSKLSSLEINKTGKSGNGISFNSLFRKGQVGDWKNHLTPQMENKIDMIIQEKLQGSGLKF